MLALSLFRQRSEEKRAWLERERIIQRMDNSVAFVFSRNEQLRRWIFQRHRLLFYDQAVRFHRVYFNCILIVFITLAEQQKTRVSDLTNFFMNTYLLLHLTLTWAFLLPSIYSVKFNFHLLAEETILCPASSLSLSLSMFANRGWTLLHPDVFYRLWERAREKERESSQWLYHQLHTHIGWWCRERQRMTCCWLLERAPADFHLTVQRGNGIFNQILIDVRIKSWRWWNKRQISALIHRWKNERICTIAYGCMPFYSSSLICSSALFPTKNNSSWLRTKWYTPKVTWPLISQRAKNALVR